MTMPEMLTIKQAAQKVNGLAESRLRQLCNDGEIPCVKAGNKYLISEAVLYKYLNGEFFVPKQQDKNAIKPIKV